MRNWQSWSRVCDCKMKCRFLQEFWCPADNDQQNYNVYIFAAVKTWGAADQLEDITTHRMHASGKPSSYMVGEVKGDALVVKTEAFRNWTGRTVEVQTGQLSCIALFSILTSYHL